MDTAHACRDCVDLHGDTPADWLALWPEGAEYRTDHREYLCDGCADERDDHAQAEDDRPDDYDLWA